jgi:hypothetical protein
MFGGPIEQRRAVRMGDHAARQAATAAAPTQSLRPTFWAGLGLEVLGTGVLLYGLAENSNITGHSRSVAKKSLQNRNIAYDVGAAVLLSGIKVHIFF